jgi:predicted N-acetyltransferase YhbS
LRRSPVWRWRKAPIASKIRSEQNMEIQPMVASDTPVSDGVSLRAMSPRDLAAVHKLSVEVRWPHRASDWEQALRFGEGLVAELDGTVVGTGARWRWGPRHATIGLVIVAPACQGRRIGHRLMSELLDGLDESSVLLHATSDGRGLYERLGFVRTGEVRQHQGTALPSPPVALDAGWRLRPAGQADVEALAQLDTEARGMPRDALIADLFDRAEATVVLDHDGRALGFGMLRRFGRGHAIGPVVAARDSGAKALIGHLSGLNAGRFTRIDVDFAAGLGEWVESLGLLRVDAPTTMVRGPTLAASSDARLYALATQALG